MDHQITKTLVALTLFLCIYGAIKLLVDASTRWKLIASGSEEMYRNILQSEEKGRRMAGLRWGIILTALAGGCTALAVLGWTEASPRTAAVLLLATGLGNLAAYAASRGTGRCPPFSK